jgi:hypothetical protein
VPTVTHGRAEFYFSRSKLGGKLNDAYAKLFASELEADVPEVMCALRSGEALRCRFLVPTYPAMNPTPEALSAPGNPDWLNPNCAEPEEEGGPLFREEDDDTADIGLGFA